MGLECWTALSAAIGAIASRLKGRSRDRYSTAWVLRVYLWAVLHERPMDWACDRRNWNPRACPRVLPDQSTISRRTRRSDFEPALAWWANIFIRSPEVTGLAASPSASGRAPPNERGVVSTLSAAALARNAATVSSSRL